MLERTFPQMRYNCASARTATTSSGTFGTTATWTHVELTLRQVAKLNRNPLPGYRPSDRPPKADAHARRSHARAPAPDPCGAPVEDDKRSGSPTYPPRRPGTRTSRAREPSPDRAR